MKNIALSLALSAFASVAHLNPPSQRLHIGSTFSLTLDEPDTVFSAPGASLVTCPLWPLCAPFQKEAHVTPV